jgi:murein DD-endopeptidase MepM/ murein hydrolase activator NlpD
MVNLSIDPPPFSGRGRGSGGPGLLRFLVYPLVLLAVGAAGGFVLGRRTAPRVPAGAEAQRSPVPAPPPVTPGITTTPPSGAPATAGAPAQPQAPAAAPAPAVASGPASTAGAGAAAPAPTPSAPQGPLVRRLSVTLKGPLEDSVASALPPGDKAWAEQLTQVMNRILVWSMQVARDGRKGDKLEVLYELPTAVPSEITAIGEAGPSVKEPIVLAFRYGSQKLGRLITAYRFKPEGAPFAKYYTSEGVEVEDHLDDSPIAQYEQVTSLLRDGRRHKGVDFKAPVGTEVRAPFDGEITRRNWHFSANGNCLELVDGKTGRHAIFLHLEAAPKEMQAGRHVKKGEVIARSGNSGHSTAPHLHYQLEAPDGRILDPFVIHATHKVSLDGPAKAAFQQERSKLDPQLVAGR